MKKIEEMTQEELASEYLHCVNAMEDAVLDAGERQYYASRAEEIKKEIQKRKV